MIIAASAYFPPDTCQSGRRESQSRLVDKLGNLLPSQRFSEDVRLLIVGGYPLKCHLLLIKELVDDVKLSIHVAMLLTRSTILTDVDCSSIVGEQKRRR